MAGAEKQTSTQVSVTYTARNHRLQWLEGFHNLCGGLTTRDEKTQRLPLGKVRSSEKRVKVGMLEQPMRGEGSAGQPRVGAI